ncbi:cytochrome P450 [Usnea florida]
MNRHPDIFPAPEKFSPDRWLLGSRGEYLKLYKHLFTFSSGPRSCIGRELAMAMIKTVLVAVYMEFSTTVVPESEKLWKNGDEAHKIEVLFERAEW